MLAVVDDQQHMPAVEDFDERIQRRSSDAFADPQRRRYALTDRAGVRE